MYQVYTQKDVQISGVPDLFDKCINFCFVNVFTIFFF